MDTTRIAEAILKDEETESIDPVELMVIQNRLLEHITGKKPIKGDKWLRRELKREKKLKHSQS